MVMLHEKFIDIEVPTELRLPVAGCDPVIFTPDDMYDDEAWIQLVVNKEKYLEEEDFATREAFIKYFLYTLGLLDYPLALISGDEGGGKSLVMAWLTYAMKLLFGKRCTLDWNPPKPELFGDYFYLYDEDFTEKIQNEVNRLARIPEPTKEDLLKLVIFNTVMGLDEADSYGDKASRTSLTKLIGRIITRRRHFHLGIFMVFVDPNTADKRYIYNRKSHIIQCGYQKEYMDTCTYTITSLRPSNPISKKLHLRPSDHTDLWNSYNVVSLSHKVYVDLGGNKKPKKEEEEEIPRDSKDLEHDKWG